MPIHPLLGPMLVRCRTSVSLWHVLFMLSLGPLVIAAGVVHGLWGGDSTMFWWTLAIGPLLMLIALAWLLWSHSATLCVHLHGVTVGRTLGTRREMWFSEIHPASIRVYEDIDSLRSPPSRMISSDWYFSGGADLAVTFVGPDRRTVLSRNRRLPTPGPGLVVFGSRAAMQISQHVRAGLERAGCPPHLARWSEQFGVSTLVGIGMTAQASVPGMTHWWKP